MPKKITTVPFPAKATVSSKVKDYGDDPYFIKKADESQEVIRRIGWPEELLILKGLKKKPNSPDCQGSTITNPS